MRHCFFRSFDVGAGDCNVIRLVDGDKQYVIMVDCGQMTTQVKEYVETVLHKHINLLIATHIDGDHIVGMAKLLKEIQGLQIDHIWYNCYKRSDDNEQVALSEHQKTILEWIRNELPVEFDAINYRREISGKQAKSLAKVILENENYHNVWKKDYITAETPDFDLPDNWGKIVFLSPEKDALAKVEELVKDAFNKYFMEVWNDGLAYQEEIGELLLRLVEAYKPIYEQRPISAGKEVYDVAFVERESKTEDADKSETNASSIAFMLECGEHRVLMLGDAYSDVVKKRLVKKYQDKGLPINCNAVKVAHHGSNGNNSHELLEQVVSPYNFIPGGKGDKYPSWGTFSRIALSHPELGKKTIVFSHSSDMSQEMNGLSDDCKAALNIDTIISEEEYELFEW